MEGQVETVQSPDSEDFQTAASSQDELDKDEDEEEEDDERRPSHRSHPSEPTKPNSVGRPARSEVVRTLTAPEACPRPSRRLPHKSSLPRRERKQGEEEEEGRSLFVE